MLRFTRTPLLCTVMLLAGAFVFTHAKIKTTCGALKSAYREGAGGTGCCGKPDMSLSMDISCNGSAVELSEYSQWEHEDGYWLGEYSYFDGNGDPHYEPDNWNYPYDHYKGFIVGSVHKGSYSQRNVFLYPPQTSSRCALDSNVAFDGDRCGLNGGIKKFEADQSTQECNLCQGGAISGMYQGKRSTTELVGAGNALLYQVFTNIDGVDTLEHSQLTTITTLANGNIHRTRTAQLFDVSQMTPGKPGPPYRASFYRETKVSRDAFYTALNNTLSAWNVSGVATNKICHGGINNLIQFLEGGRVWPVTSKYECPPAPVDFQVMVWTTSGAGQYPDTFDRTTKAGELVTTADIAAAAGVGAGLSPAQLIGYGWWADAVLLWTASGAGQYPDTFGRTTSEGELVTAADIQAAAGVGAGLTPEQLVGYGWWAPNVMLWTAAGAGQYPDTFGRTTSEGELVTAADIQAAAGVGAGLTPTQLIGYGWWKLSVDFDIKS